MREKLHISYYRLTTLLLILSTLFLLPMTSCKDDFQEENTPEWLGESIYKELERRGNFKYYLRLIDESGYDEILKRTGSKTLFVANDEAFERFFNSNNAWGVGSFEEFSLSQKTLIINSSMINNACLLHMLSNIEGPVEGLALRRSTAVSVIDSVSFEKDNLPAGKHWDRFRDKGLLLMKDKTTIPMLHFLQKQLNRNGITANDLSIIFNGQEWTDNSAYIYGIKVVEHDITCKNGYIHVLEDVLIPSSNMAEVIRNASETALFSQLLERFSVPEYDPLMTYLYQVHPWHQGSTDSVFVKRYFSKSNSDGKAYTASPDGEVQTGILSYDPGWNMYTIDNSSFQRDIAVMFVPSTEVLQNYFETGGGKFLKDRYGSWDNVPTEVLDDLINNHMKQSFINSVPSRFDKVMDDAKDPMGVKKEDILKTYIANNGIVYVTKEVYAPASYSSVMAPGLVNDNMKIFNWAVKTLLFDAYLLSMDSYYSYILPTDNALRYYIDPVSLGKSQPELFKFWYDEKAKTVKASVFKYNVATNEVGDSLRLASSAEITDRLEDMLDYHIIVGNIESGKEYYATKGGGTIRVKNKGVGMNIYGGGEIERATKSTVDIIYDQTKETNGKGNGKTYVVDKSLQTSEKSVYNILENTPEFSEFFNLLLGNETWDAAQHELYDIFYKDTKNAGLDFSIKFFSAYHYTVYIPTNEAVLRAIQRGLPTWDMINALPEDDYEGRERLTKKLINFLRYHFQDNSVYIDGASKANLVYETATLNTDINRFYTLTVNSNGSNLSLKTAKGGTANVLKNNGLYNIMARDYKFNTGNAGTSTQIETSAFAVIHQIDDVLYFE